MTVGPMSSNHGTMTRIMLDGGFFGLYLLLSIINQDLETNVLVDTERPSPDIHITVEQVKFAT